MIFQFLIFALGTQGNIILTDCSLKNAVTIDRSYSINITNFTPLTPYKLEMNFTLPNGMLVDQGQIQTQISLNGFMIFDDKQKLCDVVSQNYPCPWWGVINTASEGQIPTGLPSGQLQIRSIYNGANSAELFCIDLEGGI